MQIAIDLIEKTITSAIAKINVELTLKEKAITSPIAKINVELAIKKSLYNLGSLNTVEIYGKHNKSIYYERNKIFSSVHKITKHVC